MNFLTDASYRPCLRWAVLLAAGIAISQGCSREEPTVDWFAQLKSTDPNVRYAAVQQLGSSGKDTDRCVRALMPMLQDKEDSVRIGTTYALAKIGPAGAPATSSLVQALKDKNKQVRIGAAYALPAMGPKAQEALSSLQYASQDFDPDVRNQAAKAIQQIQIARQFRDGNRTRTK